jgi:ubiquinone/menaquinone biosynthesis C-methylase UbiE
MSERLRFGAVFDGIAEDYDVRRSGYPSEIVDAVVEIAGLVAGSPVVEVGAGTGKLTEELVGHGLRVDAVEPGENMIELAWRRLGDTDLVRFHVGRFEDVDLAPEHYDAVLAASSFHWVDPNVGWAKAALVLRPGGTIAILQPVGVRGSASAAEVLDELDDVWARVAPELAAERPAPRDEATIRKEFEERRADVSEAWSSLTHPGLGVAEARDLFGPATLTAVRRVQERTAAEMWAVFETTARYHRLSEAARAEIEAESARIIDSDGGTLRSTQLVALVTAQRLQEPTNCG